MPKNEQDKVRVPRQERSIYTKQKIVDAAVKLFAEKGYHNTNTKEIAKEAGVATGSFYSYYVDKREVFIEALKVYKTRFYETVEAGIRQSSSRFSNKRDMFKHIVTLILDAHHIFDMIYPDLDILSASDPLVHETVMDTRTSGIRMTVQFLEQWTGELKVKDVENAAVVVYFSIHRIVDLIAHRQTDMAPEPIIEQLTDMIVTYLFGEEFRSSNNQ